MRLQPMFLCRLERETGFKRLPRYMIIDIDIDIDIDTDIDIEIDIDIKRRRLSEPLEQCTSGLRIIIISV